MRQATVLAFALSLSLAFFPCAAHAATCDSLASLELANTTMTTAQVVPAGGFAVPGGRGGNAMADLPAFCRVAATIKPSSDSDIKIEVWLPVANWNGKLLAVGNAAWSGAIGYAAMADGLREGYAAASTDTGHVGGSASFGVGHPEKVIDFAYRSEHELTVKAKAIIDAFYGRGPKYSYWNGCSAGGRQSLKEAQMFPADFDGIIAGSPGGDWSGRSAQAVRIAQRLADEKARLARADLELLHTAVLQACDANDGLKDGLVSKPESCRFDPGVLLCKGGNSSNCLTPEQVETVRMIYSPLQVGSREIPGLMPGSELGWTDLGWTASARATGLEQFRYLIYGDPTWDVNEFKGASDAMKLEDGGSGAIDARDPNLEPFFERGGKLIQYHGWADPQISPLDSTTYFKEVVAAVGGANKAAASYRLFMAPGMAHCGGGDGPNTFDKMAALEQWVEHGQAPDRIVASHETDGKVDRTRPLCPYPQVATYKGSGSPDEAANFVCR